MAGPDVSAAVPKGGEAITFEGGPENFTADVERAGEELLQCLKNPKIRVICVCGHEGVGRWRIVEYATRKLKGSDLFDLQIMVKLPERDWSLRNVQMEVLHRLGTTEGDDDNEDVDFEFPLKIYESLIERKFLLILGDATKSIDLDAAGVPNIRKVFSYDDPNIKRIFSYDSKVVYVSTERLSGSEKTIELKELSIDLLRDEAAAVASSPTIAPCFTPDAVLECFFYILLYPGYFKLKVDWLTRCWIAEGIMVIREGIEEEEDLTRLEEKVDALLIELHARSMVDREDDVVELPESIAEKARDLVMSRERRDSTYGRLWIHHDSLPTEKSGEWEDIQRMMLTYLTPRVGLPHTVKFSKLSTLLLEGYGRTSTVLLNHFFFEQMQGLRVLHLSYLEIRLLPLSLSTLPNFRFLSIYKCKLLESESLLSSLIALDKLEFLQLDETPLESIPDECLQRKNNLRSLHLSSTDIRSLPSSYPELNNLQQLSVTHCSSLTEIPDVFFERMQQLRVLNLAYDGNLKSLPSSLSKLVNLRQLILTECFSLMIELLPQLRKFSSLEVLDLRSCNSIQDIEEVSSSLGAVLPNLRNLDLSEIEAIKQVILKGCQRLASLCLSDLTRLDVLDLLGTQLQELPKGISDASHLRRLDMLHMNHIHKIDWDSLSTELEELNFNDCGTFISPKDEETPRDEGGARMWISNYKLLQSLKPSSKFLRAKCFTQFHIRIFPYQEEEDGRRRGEGIHLQGRKSIYKEINLKTQTCNSARPSGHFERHLEIQGGKRCPNSIPGVLCRTELLTLCDNAFIRKLSDLGDVDEMKELRECLVMRCELMEIFLGEKNQCFERLEKIWMSDLASLRSVCEGMVSIISFPLLKHIRLEYCPRLVNFFSSGVSLPSLEKLEIRFCSRLESVFERNTVAVDGSLQRLHTVHLWELPKLERICSGRYLPELKKLTVRGCGKLKELPLGDSHQNAIRGGGGGGVEVGGELVWWKNLRWEDESIKHLIHFIEWRPLTRR